MFRVDGGFPLYMTDRTPQEVGDVMTYRLKMMRERPSAVSDELSTIPGATVTVRANGAVSVKRAIDEEWDDEVEDRRWMIKRQRYLKDFDNKRGHHSKTNKTDKHEKEKEEKKKSKKKTEESDSDSDDEDLEKMELDYMMKVAEEEEQFERQEA